MVSSPLAALKIKYKHVKGTYSKLKVAQSCLTLCDPMDYTVHGILQARILEWVAVPFSRGSSQLRDWTQLSWIAGRFLTSWVSHQGSPNQLTVKCIVSWASQVVLLVKNLPANAGDKRDVGSLLFFILLSYLDVVKIYSLHFKIKVGITLYTFCHFFLI